jgi:hypothetical protein
VNIVKETNDFLLTKITPFSDIFTDAFLPGSDGLICRHDPSTAKVTQYIDGTSSGLQNISYYAKSKNGRIAREQLDEIINALDLQHYEISDGIFITVEVLTNPMFVQKYETGEYVYTCSLKIEFIRSRT